MRSDDRGRKVVQENVFARYCAPSWLIKRAWTIQARHAYSGWDVNLRSYNVIPDSSLVHEYISDHNVNGIQELFTRGLASPFDCDKDGLSLLHVCIATLDS